MPFDPKLVQPESPPLDAAGELQLPDDLQELAAQLGDDAKYLAKTFPPTPSIGFLSAGSDDQVGQASSLPVKETDLPGQAGSLPHSPHIRRTSRRLLRAVALVASLAALTAGATWWYPRSENDPQPRNLAATPERSTTEVTHITNEATDNTRDPASPNQQSAISNQQSPPPAAAPPPASRETFLHEYSGPELEGIYDLIGDSEDDKISI